MSTSCTTTPTYTSTESWTTTTVVATYTTTHSIIPASLSVSVIPCSPTHSSAASSGGTAPPNAQCTPSSSTSTIRPESTVVSSISTTFTSTITSSRLSTQWGSSCTVISTQRDTYTQTQTQTQTQTTTYTTQAVTTNSAGSPTTVLSTIVSTATVAAEGQSSSPSPTPPPAQTSSNTGAIVGGVVGGIGVLILIAIAIWYVLKRKRKWNDVFDDFDVNDIPAANVDTEPKPYVYGTVGAPTSEDGMSSLAFSSEGGAAGMQRGPSMTSHGSTSVYSASTAPWSPTSSHQPLMSNMSPANSPPGSPGFQGQGQGQAGQLGVNPTHQRIPSISSVVSGSGSGHRSAENASSSVSPGFAPLAPTRFIHNPDEKNARFSSQQPSIVEESVGTSSMTPLKVSSNATPGSSARAEGSRQRQTEDQDHPPPAYEE